MGTGVKKAQNVLTYLVSFGASGIGILLNFILAKVLQAESFGRLQYMVALATTFSQFLILGLNTFLIREAKNKNQNYDVFSKCISLYSIVLLLGVPIAYLILRTDPTLSPLLDIYIIATAVLMGVTSLVAAAYQGRGKYRLTVLFENLIPKSVLLVLTVVFYALGRLGILEEYYLLFYVIIYFCIAVPLLIVNVKGFKLSFTKSELGSIFFFFGVTVTFSLGNNLTKVLQGGLYKNEVALAIISVSLSIIALVRVFTGVLDSMVKPLFAKLKREGNEEDLLSVYQFDTRMNSYIAIPLYIFFIIHNTRFLGLFGDSYTEFPMILSILAAANAVSDLTGPNGTMLAMTGKEKWELFNGFLYFAVYIGCVFAFSFDKTYGLCWALLAAQISVNGAKFIEIWHLYKKSPLDWKSVLTMAMVIVLNLCAIFPLIYIGDNVIWFVAGISEGICLVLLNCFVISLYRKSDFKLLLSLRV